MGEMLDCVVVGGGPAGLTAALYLARFRRVFTLIDSGASRASWIPLARNYAGFPEGIAGAELLHRMRTQAERYGAPVVQGRVERLERTGDAFRLTGANGEWTARRVILATGVVENEPNLPGCIDAVRRGLVRICPICDGYEGAGKNVGVVGNSDHAAAEALFLRTYSDAVTLILVGGDCSLPAGRRGQLEEAGIAIVETPIEAMSLEDGTISAFNLVGGETHRFDTVYSAFGVTPQYALADAVGALRDESGRLYVGDHQETSIPGLFAAGDLVRGLNQISVAVGEAALAATAVHNSLPRNRA